MFLGSYIVLDRYIDIERITQDDSVLDLENYKLIDNAAQENFDSPEDFVQNSSGKGVILFTSTWCGECKSLIKVYREQAQNPVYKTISFFEIDLDQSRDLANEMDVAIAPSLVFIDETGKVTQREVTNSKIIDSINFFSTGGVFNL